MKKLEDEKDFIDFMTDMGYSANLLEAMSLAISKPEYRTISVGMFYGLWLKKNKLKEVISPYNFGTVIGELYCGLVFAKENWIEALPDIEFKKIDESYGIKTEDFDYPSKPNPKLKDVVRRIRNSLSHSNFIIQLAENREYPELFDEAIIIFKDVNIKNANDTFEITLKVKQLKIFYTVFRDFAFKSILEREGKEPGIVDWSV